MVHTQLVLLAHGVDEVTGRETLVVSAGELLSGAVEGTTEPGTDGQETGDKSGDQVFAGTGGDDCVHSTGHGGTVVGSKHEDHLKELAGVGWETTAEPEEGHDTSDTNVLFEDVGDGQTGVEKFLATIVGDCGNEGGGLTDETELLSPGVVDGDLGNGGLGSGLDAALLEQVLVDLGKDGREVLEGVGDVDTSLLHALVLHVGSLELRVGEGTGVTELHFSGKHAGDRTNGPGHDGLGDCAVLYSLNHAVLLNTTNLTEQHEDLALRVGLVAEHVVDKSGTGVSVTTNGHTFVDTVGGVGNDVVELVGHTSRLGDVTDGTLTVELGSDNVVHHTTSVTNLVRAGLDTTDSRRTNDCDALLLRDVENLTRTPLWYTLSNDSNGLDLRVFHELHGGLVDGSRGGKVDDCVNITVLGDGLVCGLVDREESLGGTPVPGTYR